MTTTAAIKAEAKAPPPPLQPIERERLVPTQETRMSWRVVVPSRAHYDAMLRGDLSVLRQIGERLGGGDVVEVTDDASSFFALVFVRLAITSAAMGVSHVELVELLSKPLGEAVEPIKETGEWHIAFAGPHRKWCLVRPNGTIARDHMHTRDEAQVTLSRQAGQRIRGIEIEGKAMAIGSATVTALAKNAIEGTMGPDLNALAAFWSPTDTGGQFAATLAQLGGPPLGLSINQVALCVSCLANSPTKPFSSMVGSTVQGTPAAQKLSALKALVANMLSSGRTKAQAPSTTVQDATQNLLVWSADSGGTVGVSGGDLTAWLGANVA